MIKLVGRGVVVGGSVVCQVVMIDHIEEVDIAVLTKIGVQGETEHPMITPASNLLADVEDGGRKSRIVLENPHSAIPVPFIHRADFIKGNPDRALPITAN